MAETQEGISLFWAGMNKGKRSIPSTSAAPRDGSSSPTLITAPGPEPGIFLSNFPESGWLGDERCGPAVPT